eukprot:2033392-Rhodomonas_salina.2
MIVAVFLNTCATGQHARRLADCPEGYPGASLETPTRASGRAFKSWPRPQRDVKTYWRRSRPGYANPISGARETEPPPSGSNSTSRRAAGAPNELLPSASEAVLLLPVALGSGRVGGTRVEGGGTRVEGGGTSESTTSAEVAAGWLKAGSARAACGTATGTPAPASPSDAPQFSEPWSGFRLNPCVLSSIIFRKSSWLLALRGALPLWALPRRVLRFTLCRSLSGHRYRWISHRLSYRRVSGGSRKMMVQGRMRRRAEATRSYTVSSMRRRSFRRESWPRRGHHVTPSQPPSQPAEMLRLSQNMRQQPR